MSEKDPKKPAARDISDLKARLGLKKDAGRAGGAIPPPGAAKMGGAYVPPPPGLGPPPQAAMPDARIDPFGAMNAIAAQGAAKAAPEIIVVHKGEHEVVGHSSHNWLYYAKVGGIVLLPLLVGFFLGGINVDRNRYNATLTDAKALYGEFKGLGKNLEDLNIILLGARERGDGGKVFALGDKQLVADLERLNFNVVDDEHLIVYHANLYNLEPKLVQDTLLFYSRVKTLSAKVKEHVRLTKLMLSKPSQDALAKLGSDTQLAAVVRVPTQDEAAKGGRPTVEVVQLGAPVCPDGKPGCGESPGGFQFRNDPGGAWGTKALASTSDAADKVLFLKMNPILRALLEGSQKYSDELAYYIRLDDIDVLTKDLVKDRKEIEDKMNALAQRGKSFAL